MSILLRAVRETRKYGRFFISQTLGGIDQEILQQLRILASGFGLALGSEFDRLGDFAGSDKRSLELYQSLPQSFPRRDLQEFPFMAVGPISPLAFSGKPVFFTASPIGMDLRQRMRFRSTKKVHLPPTLGVRLGIENSPPTEYQNRHSTRANWPGPCISNRKPYEKLEVELSRMELATSHFLIAKKSYFAQGRTAGLSRVVSGRGRRKRWRAPDD